MSFSITERIPDNKSELYQFIAYELEKLLDGCSDDISNLSNTSALLWQYLKDINWVGFYVTKGGNLHLGPFQGKPACTFIEHGKGVCGAALKKAETILVEDVHAFPGHIACDSASNSEIVIPLVIDGEVKAVLDIDSPFKSRFDETDKIGLEKIAEIIIKHVGF